MDSLSNKLINLERDIIQSKIKYLNMDITYTLRDFYNKQIERYQKSLSIIISNLKINKSLNHLMRHIDNNKETHLYYLNKNISLNMRMLRSRIYSQYTGNILNKFSILHKIIYYKKDVVYNRIKNRIIHRERKERECKKIEKIFHDMVYKIMCKNIEYIKLNDERNEDSQLNGNEGSQLNGIENNEDLQLNGIENKDLRNGNEDSQLNGNEGSQLNGIENNEDLQLNGIENNEDLQLNDERNENSLITEIKIKTEDCLVEVNRKSSNISPNIVFKSVEMSTNLIKVSSKTTCVNKKTKNEEKNFNEKHITTTVNIRRKVENKESNVKNQEKNVENQNVKNYSSDLLKFHFIINNSFSKLNNSMIMKLINFYKYTYTDSVKLKILFTLKNVEYYIKGVSFYSRRVKLQTSDRLSFILQKGSLDNDRRFLMMIDDTLSDIEKYKDPVIVRMGIQFILAKKYIEDIIYLKE